jgi:hypothetical protein
VDYRVVDISVRDLVPDYLAFERAAQQRAAGERRSLWRQLYAERHPDVFECYLRIGGEPPELDSALARLVGSGELFARRARRTSELIHSHAPRVVDKLDAGALELPYVIMVGVFRADGWMADLVDTPTAFFAVEQYKDPPWDDVTVVHETAHLVHAALQPEPWPDEQLGLRLLLEGLAIAATHELLPDLPEWAHFNFPPAELDAWLRACAEAEPRVGAQLRQLLTATDPDDRDRYFSPDWLRDARDVPPKVGYYLGARVVERLRQRLSLADLARLGPAEALALAADALAYADSERS